jgi:hypothetical protein
VHTSSSPLVIASLLGSLAAASSSACCLCR